MNMTGMIRSSWLENAQPARERLHWTEMTDTVDDLQKKYTDLTSAEAFEIALRVREFNQRAEDGDNRDEHVRAKCQAMEELVDVVNEVAEAVEKLEPTL